VSGQREPAGLKKNSKLTLAPRDALKACEAAGCTLQTTLADAQNGPPPQLNLNATPLHNALFKSAIWKLGPASEPEQNKTQRPSDGCSTSDPSQAAGGDPGTGSKDSPSDTTSLLGSEGSDTQPDKSRDDVPDTPRDAAEVQSPITSHEGKCEARTETSASDPPPAATQSSDHARPAGMGVEEAHWLKAVKSPVETGLDFGRVSESASHPRAEPEAPCAAGGVAKKLSKDAKAQRAAALKNKIQQRKKEHEEQVEDLLEEIAHQREVLRSRRDQKKQKQKLHALRERLERLCKKELEDDEYMTSDDEEEDEDASSENDPPPPATTHDEGPGSDGADPAKDEPDPSPAGGDSTAEAEAEDTNAWPTVSSKAKQEWEERKQSRDEENIHLDGIMDFVGLESVKSKMLEIKTLVDTARRQDVNLAKERFNTVLVGNSGTGKTSMAKLYAKFLSSLELGDDMFVATTGSKLVYEGVNELKNIISLLDERGIILIDDVHIIRPDISSTGRKVLDYVVNEMDRLQGNVIFIFTGSGKSMETFLTHNKSLQSRIPFTITFEDYQDAELLQILEKQLHDKFNGKMKVEKGVTGVYMRIVARRLGRCRGPSNFGNAREVENTLLRILFRQAVRLEESRKAGKEVDDLLLTKEDIIGPPPSAALENSKAWQSLQGMVGLRSVKESLRAMVHRLQINYDRELAEKPVIDCSLNRIFLGNPGTGKTTVAKYYGQIMVDIGLLTDGEVVVKSPADFIGEYLGESENITKRILASAKGKVLIIDEAYALNDSSDEANEHGSGNIC
jgi:Holliday junction resolvasome RuvABC ATP-dependent DNA helicase subunit